MKIAILSDTHFGFSKNTYKILQKFIGQMEDPDVLLHCGDWISHKQKSFAQMFRLIRERFPTIPVLGVRGNHDLWDHDGKFKSVDALVLKQQELWIEHRIHYLHDEPFILDNVTFFGFDGFYHKIPPLSNDCNYFPKGRSWEDLRERSAMRMKDISTQAYNTKGIRVCVTHFSLYPTHDMGGNTFWMYDLIPSFDYIIWGHSHTEQDFVFENTRIINPGGGYDKPKAKIFLI